MAFVYINGYPAVGKLTVANELTHVYPSLLAVIFLNLRGSSPGSLYHHRESLTIIASLTQLPENTKDGCRNTTL